VIYVVSVVDRVSSLLGRQGKVDGRKSLTVVAVISYAFWQRLSSSVEVGRRFDVAVPILLRAAGGPEDRRFRFCQSWADCGLCVTEGSPSPAFERWPPQPKHES